MQVNVEANEIHICHLQVFRWGIGGKSEKAMRVKAPGLVNEFADEVLDAADSAPADDLGGNFVNDTEREDGGMALAGGDGVAHDLARVGLQRGRVQETEVFGPRNVHQDLQALVVEEIKKPKGRDVVNAEDVCAECVE